PHAPCLSPRLEPRDNLAGRKLMEAGRTDAFTENKINFPARRFFVDFHMFDELRQAHVPRNVRRQPGVYDEPPDALEAVAVAGAFGDRDRRSLDHADRDG